MDLTNKLIEEMISYNRGDAKRIQHFIKVYSFAKLIGETEDLSPAELFVLETAQLCMTLELSPQRRNTDVVTVNCRSRKDRSLPENF